MKKYLCCRFEEKEKIKELRGHWVQEADSDKMGDGLKEYREVNVTFPYDSKMNTHYNILFAGVQMTNHGLHRRKSRG